MTAAGQIAKEMPMTTEEPNLKALRTQLRAAGKLFAEGLADLVPAAAELARIEGAIRVAEHRAGVFSGAPPARELTTELLHGRLKCLRPYTPFVTCESADRATEALCAKPAQTNREKALP